MQFANCIRPEVNYMHMAVVDVQQQIGGDDCSLFAIPFAALSSLRDCVYKITH